MSTFVVNIGPSNVNITSTAQTITTTSLSYNVMLDSSMTALALNNMFCFNSGSAGTSWLSYTGNNLVYWLLSSYVVTPSDSPQTYAGGCSFPAATGTFPSIANFKVNFAGSNNPTCYLSYSGVDASGSLGQEFLSYLYAQVNYSTSTNGFTNFSNQSTYISSLHTQIDSSLNSLLITNSAAGYPMQQLSNVTPKSFNTNPPIAYQLAAQLYKNNSTRFYNTASYTSLGNNNYGILLPGDTVFFSIVNITTPPTQKTVFNSTLGTTTRQYLIKVVCT